MDDFTVMWADNCIKEGLFCAFHLIFYSPFIIIILQALQSVLNACIMQKRKYDHITSTLRNDLHWLPIRQRIMYKLSTIAYNCIHGAAPSYLTNLCVPVATNTSRRYLCSATHGDLLVPIGRELWPMDHEVLLFRVLVSRTLCHRPCVYRPLRSNSFRVE